MASFSLRSLNTARAAETRSGWLFVTPIVVILGIFLVAPILIAFWVSISDWAGNGSPLAPGVESVGGSNYAQLLVTDSLARSDFMTSLRNNFYYVLLVVPLQTVLAFVLALLLNQQKLKGGSFFRTAYYFPTVTSSVAIASVFLFLFAGEGTVNAALDVIGVQGPKWFSDPRGLLHMVLNGIGVGSTDHGPAGLESHMVLGLSLWDWVSGPSVAMMTIIFLVVWTSAGGYMLLFLAALQNIPKDTYEAASIDGASPLRQVFAITLPQIKPTVFTVLTLGLIGTWQVFDQVYIMSKGAPGKTTLTPAFLAYDSSINNGAWGQGAAMSFILFAIILVLTGIQSLILRERTPRAWRRTHTQETPA